MNDHDITLSADEGFVLRFLQHWPDAFISETEIARRANGKTRFSENPDWAAGALELLLERGLVEHNNGGRFRAKNNSTRRCTNKRRFATLRLREALLEAGYCANCLTKHEEAETPVAA
jgi:hypothetical protein